VKRLVLLLVLMSSIRVLAQNDSPLPEPTQDSHATYRLFRTANIYTFLKLDTRTGQIWQVQWATDDQHRLTTVLNRTILVPVIKGEQPRILEPGRFTLSPTSNIHTFVLLDTEDGRTWQVQWGDEGHRLLLPIE
jgi:hypothetical protein